MEDLRYKYKNKYIDREYLFEYLHDLVFEEVGEDYLKEACERGKGVIIYGAHFGNWEWMAAVLALLGYPLNAIALEQSNGFFNEKINEIREEKGINIITKGISVRKTFSYLKNGECVYILGDQDAGKKGWEIDFFGQSASTYPGAVRLAQRTGASIVPVFLIRNKAGRFRLKIKQQHTIPHDINRDQQKEHLQELVNITEEVIKDYPSQWFWLHRRWKTY
jgi:KDO2-lipid IV(A) lauroyltransferase